MNLVGNLASVIGVIIASVGFVITIRNVGKSKKAADRAEIAANKTLERVRYVDNVQNLSRAISVIEEILRLNRTGEWKVLLDRHLIFRSILIDVKRSATNLSDDHKAIIQDGITHSGSISHNIEVALDEDSQPASIPRMNKILSKQVEQLRDILAEMRMETDG